MKRLLAALAIGTLMGTTAIATGADAQGYHHDRGHHDRYDRHDRYDHRDNRGRGYNAGYHNGWRDRSDWRRGGYVSYNDWHRGYVVDYRSHHLRAPPRGYEWRRVNNNYVLAAVATGLIASIILNN